MRSTRFRGQAGWTCIDAMIAVTVILIIGVVAFVSLLSRLRASRDTECVIHMDRLRAGQTELVCPVSDEPYRIVEKDGRKTISCPDKGKHLVTDARFVEENGKWRFDQTFPAAGAAPAGPVELSDGSLWYSTWITVEKDRIVLEENKSFLLRYVFSGMLVVFATVVFWGVLKSIRERSLKIRHGVLTFVVLLVVI